MKDIIGAIAFGAFVVVGFWALLGVYGTAIGSSDDCTRSFVRVCSALGIGGAK